MFKNILLMSVNLFFNWFILIIKIVFLCYYDIFVYVLNIVCILEIMLFFIKYLRMKNIIKVFIVVF